MRRRNLDVLIAWLAAARRGDRAAMLELLAGDATWGDSASPETVVERWLGLPEAETLELAADERRAVVRLRGTGERHVAFTIDGDGKIASVADSARRRDVFPTVASEAPRGIPEAPLRDGAPDGPGWFVLNAADARWVDGFFGAYTPFAWGDRRFEQLGVNLAVIEPGQALCYYHREGDQEDFLVLRGEALLLIEGQERRVRAWDFVHCPPWTDHVFVGAGDGPCTLLAIGGRDQRGVVYPVSDLALRHGAGVREETAEPAEAYAEVPDDGPATFDSRWLPGD